MAYRVYNKKANGDYVSDVSSTKKGASTPAEKKIVEPVKKKKKTKK